MTRLTEKISKNLSLKVWISLPETFNCMKNLIMTELSVFSSTISSKSLFSVMNFVKYNSRSRLSDETVVCVCVYSHTLL